MGVTSFHSFKKHTQKLMDIEKTPHPKLVKKISLHGLVTKCAQTEHPWRALHIW